MSQQTETSRDRLTIASLNTRGIPLLGSHLAERYGAIAGAFEAAAVDVVSFQEVLTYYHLRQLTRRMPSFRYVSYRPSAVGPAGGLATLSRIPVTASEYERFPIPPATSMVTLPWLTRFKASLKGTLLTRLAQPRMCVVNTHLLANVDGDWSESSRFYAAHQGQLAALARVVDSLSDPSVVCGDFNIASDSTLHRDFMIDTGLVDAFGGQCPPTFHARYLGPGKSPHCIDFVLIAGSSIKVESADLMFTDKLPMSAGPAYVSDHKGLCVRALVVT
jgi:endonuclease/exonuclease/phosphatase family metal-dependent hydrolase